MDAETLGAMTARDWAEWEALVEVLEARPSGSLHDPAQPDWEAKDVYTHLAEMMDWTADAIATLLRGERITWEGDDEDEVNSQIQRRHAQMSLAEARSWAVAAFERRLDAIGTVPFDRWNQMMDQVVRGDGWEHFVSHRAWAEEAAE